VSLPRVVAITGLHTFAGSGIARRLLAWDPPPTLVGIDLTPPDPLAKQLRFHPLDLTEPSADSRLTEILEKERCEALLHAAFAPEARPDIEAQHDLEVLGSLSVMRAVGAARVPKLVVTSTAEVYGAHPDNPGYLTESHPLRPDRRAHRVRDRAEVESLLRAFASRHRQTAVTSLRPCWLVGPSIDALHVRHLSAPRVRLPLGYDPLVQLLHEDDWLDALELSLGSDASGVFNLAGDGVLMLSTLVLRSGARIRRVPRSLLSGLGQLPSLARTGDPPGAFYDYLRFSWLVDTRRARIDLGFRPTYSTREAWMSVFVGKRMRDYR
jgi:UDP-glucose 4-epimerase